MGRQQPIELFMPPNMLKAKVGGSGGLDMAAIKRAESAMNGLKSTFSDMAGDAVTALVAAQKAYAAKADPASRGGLLRAAHDIKGLAGTFDFPLMGRVAGSLSRLVGEAPADKLLPVKLVEAHIAAVQAIHRKSITGMDDRVTLALLAELEAQVGAALKA
ncbi:MAG: Hpt domain-containing protein [Alphaproteobacteria bacterium]|nr:Hpt domain-containing protein [Alphaproteobacteria bacterium]